MRDHARESTLPFEPPGLTGDETAVTGDDGWTHGVDRHGRVERIWIKRAKRGPMDAVESATADAGRGIRGNANRGGRRQVTIISRERWNAIIGTLGVDLDPSTRRANLMISGLDLEKSRGKILRIGSVRLRINGETRPCEQMEEAHAGLQDAMRAHWGGGAFAEVLDAGEIRVGDWARWDEPGGREPLPLLPR